MEDFLSESPRERSSVLQLRPSPLSDSWERFARVVSSVLPPLKQVLPLSDPCFPRVESPRERFSPPPDQRERFPRMESRPLQQVLLRSDHPRFQDSESRRSSHPLECFPRMGLGFLLSRSLQQVLLRSEDSKSPRFPRMGLGLRRERFSPWERSSVFLLQQVLPLSDPRERFSPWERSSVLPLQQVLPHQRESSWERSSVLPLQVLPLSDPRERFSPWERSSVLPLQQVLPLSDPRKLSPWERFSVLPLQQVLPLSDPRGVFLRVSLPLWHLV